ncbi:isoprenylcysteine carboxylmethyltransferase family protein [Colwellia sp. RSH04]|mgnify:CR=1 FL=1|uniref:methyltransferase family protein n=1 Tax=Colwellia sp. RSH04 TaxID=2305464 RepID=UPI000E586B7F|nr:isoprenylcysteine carboxylmethyltransferase family protein [Colwellia sp. RSH04]RHW76059.1 isoprenylcysteine carboxylmethyltransferase family protein [Colwellia sp. RSH04]
MDLKIIPVIQCAIAMLLMWLCYEFLPSYSYARQMPILSNGYLPSVLVIVAVYLAMHALLDFKKHGTTFHPHTPEKTSKVVSSGVYRFSRNPMYLAMLLALIAIALLTTNLIALLVLPLFIMYITRFQIQPEEKALGKLFGKEYDEYCQKVRRWL